jgi:hypothetical protein
MAQKADAVGSKVSAVSVKRATADSSIAAVDYIIKRWLPIRRRCAAACCAPDARSRSASI